MGLTVVGGLIATYVSFKIDYVWTSGDAELNVQTDILDQIMPAMFPLVYTLLMYWLLKKGHSPLMLIGLTVVVGLLGSFFKIM